MQVTARRRPRPRTPNATPLQPRTIGRTAALILATSAAGFLAAGEAAAKSPGSTYCFYGTCHRVKSIAETERAVGEDVTLAASFYDSCKNDPLNPCSLTSSGEAFDPSRPDNAASPIYPDGTILLVWSPETHHATVLRVNNAGPYWGNRKLDVSRAAAEVLGFRGRGVADLRVRVIDAPDREEATYSKNRRYDTVLGYIGEYPSLDAAEAGMTALHGLEAVATVMLAPLAGRTLEADGKPDARKPQLKVASRTVRRASPPRATTPEADLAQLPMEVARLFESVGRLFVPARATQGGPSTRAKSGGEPAVRLAKAEVRTAAAPAAKRKPVRVAEAKAKPRVRASGGSAKKVTVARAKVPAPTMSGVAGPPNDNPTFARHQAEASAAMAPKAAAQKRAQVKSPARTAAFDGRRRKAPV